MLNMSITGRLYFNSRPSARGDVMHEVCSHDVRISIHAPPRGATLANALQGQKMKFQFTPLREGRPESG